MKRLTIIFCSLIFIAISACSAKSKPTTPPGEKYIFFLHHKFVELFDLTEVHPEYGRAEYKEVLAKFREAGFVVLSEKRPRDTDAKRYAQKIARQVDSLLKLGVKPGNITVIGCSKGGYITQYVSTMLKNPAVNFVFIGAYQDNDLHTEPDINLCGNILSIYEVSDSLGVSAVKRIKTSKQKVSRFKEIELHTGRRHGFLYHPMDEWIQPCIQWASGDYSTLVTWEIKKLMDSILTSDPREPFSGNILIQEGGKTVYSYTNGFANIETKEKITTGNEFVIGSISKQFTGVLLLLEMEKGRIHLQDPIRKYLPGLKATWADSVTIYHLVTHSHGITRLDAPLSFTPGARMDYEHGNNIGFRLLSEVIEKTSGKSFATLSMELFKKCGMNHSFHPGIKKYKQLADGYMQQTDGSLVADSNRFLAAPAAGTFVSTVADMLRWNECLHGGKILNAASYTLMTTIQPRIVRQHPVWGPTLYGLGTTIKNDDNLLQYGQTGFVPGHPSMNFYFPATKTSVIVLGNVAYNGAINDRFYYHFCIINMLRERLKCGKKVAMPALH